METLWQPPAKLDWYSESQAIAKLNRSTGQTEEETSDAKSQTISNINDLPAGDSDHRHDGPIVEPVALTSQSVSAPDWLETELYNFAHAAAIELGVDNGIGATSVAEEAIYRNMKMVCKIYASSSNAALQKRIDDWKQAFIVALNVSEAKVSDLEEVLADKRRLTRVLDVIWNGEDGAAPQASLCDIVGQIETELPALRDSRDSLRESYDKLSKLFDELKALFDKLVDRSMRAALGDPERKGE